MNANSIDALRHDLQLAANFQRAVLPKPVSLSYLRTAVTYRPHGEVSGDVYHFLQNRERELAVFVGDATGHGVAAALLTMMVLLALDNLRRNLPADDSMRELNRMLAARQTGMSVTGVFFRITPEGKLTVAHAGHPPLMVIPADGKALVQFQKGGCPLGIFEDEPVPYEQEEYQLKPGDKVFAYTDAALEWQNSCGEQFGANRLAALLECMRDRNVEAINRACVEALEIHADGNPCADDLTMLVLEYTGQAHPDVV